MSLNLLCEFNIFYNKIIDLVINGQFLLKAH
jgi:hypothetical protein